jgi:primosomal protein N' (replication factor Y)
VVIQTYNPNDFTVNCAIQSNIRKFINNEYSERNMAHYPPFSRIATVNFSGKTETKVREKSQQVAAFLHQHNQTKIDILGPVSNPIGKIKNRFRYFLLLKSRKESDPSGSNLRNLLKQLTFSENLKSSAVNVSIDIDPSGMI